MRLSHVIGLLSALAAIATICAFSVEKAETFQERAVLIEEPDEHGDWDTIATGELILEVTRQPGLGFCPNPDHVLTATVTVGENGGYLFTGTGVVKGDASIDECALVGSPYHFPGAVHHQECWVQFDLARQILSEEQASELDALVASVPEMLCESRIDSICDWCLISLFEFTGGQRVTPNCCGPVNHDFPRAIADIERFLAELGGL